MDVESEYLTGVGFSEKAVWSRASRRQVARKQGDAMEEDDDPEMAFGFKIHVDCKSRMASLEPRSQFDG
jgi:23S rRNA (adenine1618-N6)-methyltransferase